MTNKRVKLESNEDSQSGMGFKHIKTKDNAKDLVCHMIGIMGLLIKEFRASMVGKLIKKDVSDLKSYFQELGFSYEAVKENGKDDLIVKFTGSGSLLQRQKEAVIAEGEESNMAARKRKPSARE